MRFSYTEDQDDLRAVVREFLARNAGSAALRAAIDLPEGHDPALWARIVGELELTALQLGEQDGGAGASFVEVGLVLEETGRVLLPGPYLSTVTAAAVLRDARDRQATAPLIARLAAGETATLAAAEDAGDWTLEGIAASAAPAAGGWRLDGVKQHVLDGADAGLLLVAADSGDGPGLFAVDGAAPGVQRTPHTTLDSTRRQARVVLTGAPTTRITAPGDGGAAIGRALDVVAVALACESVGAAARCLELTVAHLQERVQFGRPLGSFQALRHRCADLAAEIEAATSTARYAAWAVDGAPDELPLIAPLAKAYCSDAFRHVAAETIQLHGGIGFTWEHDAHLYFKRATSTELLFGSSRALRRRVGALAGLL